jgi:hypothetical protein
MTIVVNLNNYRKQHQRAEGQRRAAENRVRFGRRKRDRDNDLRERERAKEEIEGKRLD